jgi:protein NirF
MKSLLSILAAVLLSACAAPALRGTGDLGLVIERASGSVAVVDNSARAILGRVEGLGDLSHASAVYSRDGRYAYVFGRDGGLTKVDLLERKIAKRILQAGNSIGGAISQDGRLVAAQNYQPGGIKVFDAETLELLADIPAEFGNGQTVFEGCRPGRRAGQQVRLRPVRRRRDLGRRPVDAARTEADEIPRHRQQPYDGLVTPDGRHYIAGLFGEDGLALIDLWKPEQGAQRSSPTTARARRSCRCSRCRTCAAGQWPAGAPTCPPSASTRCWWSTPPPGRKSAASR